LAAGTACGSRPGPAPAPPPPDIVLVTVDTLRADALGASGAPGDPTPLLDRLAAGGVRFTGAHAHAVLTLPAHASILSGRLPPDHGLRDNAGFRFPAGVDTLATLLQARGYATGAFVSAFPLDSRFGLDRGFDVYDDALGGAERPAFLVAERPGVETVARALRWRAAQGGRPVFTWVHVYEPHFPYTPAPAFAARFPGQAYRGEVAAADDALRPLLEPLLGGTEGAAARTIVLVTADHGEALGEHGEPSHGTFAYEATLKVPLLLHAPGRLAPRVVDAPARHVDILPTLLEAAGQAVPAGLPGRSLLPLARGEGGAPVDTYFEALSPQLNRGWAPLHGLIHEGVKYIDLPEPELYDLRADAAEAHNRILEEPQRAAALQALLRPLVKPAAPRAAEGGDARERLRSLGYAAGGAPVKERYTAADDPKRLVALDALMQDMAALSLAGDVDGARARCLELLRRRPDTPVALVQLAQLERDRGRPEAAIAALRRAAALRPGDASTLALLGADLTQAGRPAEAVALLEAPAGAAAPDPDVLTTRAVALARLGRFAEAQAALDRAVRGDPTNGGLLVHAGTVALMAGRRDAARDAFTRALALDPALARAQSSLAYMEAEDGHTAEALERWTSAVALDAREWAKLPALGAFLWQRGRRDEARAYLDFFVRNAPASYAGEAARVRRFLEGAAR